jgi:hypothetical protein
MLNRRGFLQLAVGWAALAVVPSTVFGKNAPREKMTIAFIGSGNHGYGNLGPFLRDK